MAFIPVALLVGFGIYLFVRGGTEAQEESVMQKQRQLLDILKSRGQVSVNDMALEMHVSVDQVQGDGHQLVGLQVFSGYINWDDGILYSSEAKRTAQAGQVQELRRRDHAGGQGDRRLQVLRDGIFPVLTPCIWGTQRDRAVKLS